MGTYATPAELRGETGDTDAALDDAEAERLLTEAERRVDRLAGPGRLYPTGRRFDPVVLGESYAAALREATLILAAARRRNPTAFDAPAAKTISGPDFTLTDVAAVPPAGATAIREASSILRGAGLAVTSARGVA